MSSGIPLQTALTSVALPTAAPAVALAQPASADPAMQKLEEAAEKFESMFINEMLKQMRRTTREVASEDSPSKSRINEDMLAMADLAVADAMASQRAFGIADVILRQMAPTIAPVEQRAFHESGKPVALD